LPRHCLVPARQAQLQQRPAPRNPAARHPASLHPPSPQVLDPHVAIVLSDGSALLLRGDPAGRRLGLARTALKALHDSVHADPDDQVGG
jgi:hypothetical protein